MFLRDPYLPRKTSIEYEKRTAPHIRDARV